MVKVRIMGTLDDVLSVKKDLRKKGFDIVWSSQPYKNRGSELVRVYVNILPSGCAL